MLGNHANSEFGLSEFAAAAAGAVALAGTARDVERAEGATLTLQIELGDAARDVERALGATLGVVGAVDELTGRKPYRGKQGTARRREVTRLADLADLLAQQQADEAIGKEQLQADQIDDARRKAYQALKGLESAQEALETIVKLEVKLSYTEEKLLKKKLQKLADEEISDWMLILALLD